MNTCLALSEAADAVASSDPARIAPPATALDAAPIMIQVLSDLHFDAGPCAMPRLAPGADVVVVAGDTCQGAEKAFAFLRAAFPLPFPLVVVLGNHEYYGRAIGDELRRARAIAPDYGVTLLEDGTAEILGVRFVGGTLWTDYRLDGPGWQVAAMEAAAAGMSDHARISVSRYGGRFTPRAARAMHRVTRTYIGKVLCEPFDGPTVVVTHHAPSGRSLDPRFEGDLLNSAFASRLDRTVAASGAALWVHGHTHHSCDYSVGGTRVLANPHGYGAENPQFDPALVVEVLR